MIVGHGARNEFSGTDPGGELQFGQNKWKVVGIFDAATMNWQSFSQVAFAFHVNGRLVVLAMLYALSIGLAGGIFPAIRAARMPVADAL